MSATKTFEIGHRPSGEVRTGCLHTIDVMEMSIFNNRHGVVPSRQVVTVSGKHGPSHATGTSIFGCSIGMRKESKAKTSNSKFF